MLVFHYFLDFHLMDFFQRNRDFLVISSISLDGLLAVGILWLFLLFKSGKTLKEVLPLVGFQFNGNNGTSPNNSMCSNGSQQE